MMYRILVEGTENCTVSELAERLNEVIKKGYGNCPVCDSENYLHGDIGAEWDTFDKFPPKDESTIVIC